MSSCWLTLKQQWTIEEIYNFSNNSHLERWAGLSDTISKGTHPMTISAMFDLVRFGGFRGQDLNVKVYDVRWIVWLMDERLRTTDVNWWQKLTRPLVRWANNRDFSLLFCYIFHLNVEILWSDIASHCKTYINI